MITINVEACSALVSAASMYKAMFLDMDVVIPKVLPQVIKTIQIVNGDGGVGTIKKVTFGRAVKMKSMKQKVDVVDKKAMRYDYTVIEGDALLSGKLESIANQFTVLPAEDGGCIVKLRAIYTPIVGEVVPDESVEEATQQSFQIFKAVEGYIIAD